MLGPCTLPRIYHASSRFSELWCWRPLCHGLGGSSSVVRRSRKQVASPLAASLSKALETCVCLVLMWLGNVDNTAFWSNWSYPSQHHVSLAKRLKLVCLVLVWLGSVENTTPNAFETSVSGISVAWNCWKHHWFQRFLVGWLMSWEEVTLFHFKSCAFIRSKPHYCQRGGSLFIPRAALSLGRGHATCQTQWFRMFLDFLRPPESSPEVGI